MSSALSSFSLTLNSHRLLNTFAAQLLFVVVVLLQYGTTSTSNFTSINYAVATFRNNFHYFHILLFFFSSATIYMTAI